MSRRTGHVSFADDRNQPLLVQDDSGLEAGLNRSRTSSIPPSSSSSRAFSRSKTAPSNHPNFMRARSIGMTHAEIRARALKRWRKLRMALRARSSAKRNVMHSRSLEFQSDTFWKEFLIELTQPICLLVLIPLRGTTPFYNRKLLGTSGDIIFRLLAGLLFWLTMITTFVRYDQLISHDIFIEVIAMCLVIVIRAIMVASRMAYRYRPLHQRCIRGEVRLSTEFMECEEMISGWFRLPRKITQDVMEMSQHRCNIKDEALLLVQPSRCDLVGGQKAVREALSQGESMFHDGEDLVQTVRRPLMYAPKVQLVAIPLKLWVMQAVLSEGVEAMDTSRLKSKFVRLTVFKFFGAFGQSTIPLLVRLIRRADHPLGEEWPEVFVTFSCIFISFIVSYYFIFVFMYGLLFHYQRKLQWIKLVGHLIGRHRGNYWDNSDMLSDFEKIRLSLTAPENVVAWYNAWLWLYDIGAVFQKRLNVFFSILFTLVLCAMLGMMGWFFFSPSLADIITSNTAAALNVLIIFLSTFIIAILTQVAVHGELISMETEEHIFWLYNHALTNQQLITESSTRGLKRVDLDRVQHAIYTMEHVGRQLKQVQAHQYIRLCKIRMSSATTSMIMTIGTLLWVLSLSPWLTVIINGGLG